MNKVTIAAIAIVSASALAASYIGVRHQYGEPLIPKRFTSTPTPSASPTQSPTYLYSTITPDSTSTPSTGVTAKVLGVLTFGPVMTSQHPEVRSTLVSGTVHSSDSKDRAVTVVVTFYGKEGGAIDSASSVIKVRAGETKPYSFYSADLVSGYTSATATASSIQ